MCFSHGRELNRHSDTNLMVARTPSFAATTVKQPLNFNNQPTVFVNFNCPFGFDGQISILFRVTKDPRYIYICEPLTPQRYCFVFSTEHHQGFRISDAANLIPCLALVLDDQNSKRLQNKHEKHENPFQVPSASK